MGISSFGVSTMPNDDTSDGVLLSLEINDEV